MSARLPVRAHRNADVRQLHHASPCSTFAWVFNCCRMQPSHGVCSTQVVICVKRNERLVGHRPAPWLSSANNYLYWFQTFCHGEADAHRGRGWRVGPEIKKGCRGGTELQRISTGNWEKFAFLYESLICHKGDCLFLSTALWFPSCLGLGVFFLLLIYLSDSFTLQDGGKINRWKREG